MTGDKDSLWLKRYRDNGDALLTLVCFSYAGGGASVFRDWPAALPPPVNLFAVQLPGRESRLREPPFQKMSDLVAAIGPVIAEQVPAPFAFFGHSMGALVSFELTRYLRRECGLEPLHLFVSGRQGPHLPGRLAPIHALPDDEFKAGLKRFNGTPQEVLDNPELMELLAPILRSDLAVCETYLFSEEPPLSCPITMFAGSEDPGVHPSDLESWSGLTTERFAVHLTEGDHFFLRTKRSWLLDKLSGDLMGLVTQQRLNSSANIFSRF